MTPKNLVLYEELAEITDNLTFGYDGKIHPFIWEVEDKGVCSAYEIVMQHKIWGISSIRLEDFEKFNQSVLGYSKEEYQYIFDVLTQDLTDFEFYVGYYPDEVFCLFIGKTHDSQWIGIGSGFVIDIYASFVGRFETSQTYLRNKIPLSSEAIKVLSSLEEKGLSQTEFPIWDVRNRGGEKKYIYEVAQGKKDLLEQLMISTRLLVIQEFGEGIDVLASKFYVPEDDPQRDYKKLDLFITSKLTDLKIYIVGLASVCEFNIYVVGITSSGDYAGVLIDVSLNT